MNEGELKILLSELRSLASETEWIEFKMNNATELGEYLSALSNSACIHDKEFGYIVFGVDDSTHRIKGTTFSVNQKGKGNEDLIPWLSRLLNPRVHFDCFEFEVDGKRVVLIRVRATQNTPVSFSGVSYVRIGSYKKKLSEYPHKEREIWTKKPAVFFEKEISKYDLSSDEVLKLIDYPSYFELSNSILPDNKDAILDKLRQEKIVVQDKGKYSITKLGAILFARKLSDFEDLERKAIRVIIYQGANKLRPIKEQVGIKGYASGFRGLIGYVNDRLPSNEEIGEAFRREVKIYPELVVRELIANAIIHQDFHENGTGPMVEIYDGRIEITNPGKPLISTMRFVDHNPQSRNEKLASFMRRLNICEERGSGIDKVIFECESHHLPAPMFVEGDNYTRVIVYAHKTLRQMSQDDKKRACYLHACLKFVSGEKMTNKSLRERFDIPAKNYSIVSRLISGCIKSGLIKPDNPESKSKKDSRYIPFWA